MEQQFIMNGSKMRVVYTILLFIAQIAFVCYFIIFVVIHFLIHILCLSFYQGLSSAIYGPTLIDLSVIFSNNDGDDTTINDGLGSVSLFFTFFCGGCITGSFCKWIHHEYFYFYF